MWQFLLQLNIYSAYDPAIPLPIFAQEEQKLVFAQKLYTNVYNSFIHNHKLWKGPNALRWWMNKQTVVTSIMDHLLNNKKQWITDAQNMDECVLLCGRSRSSKDTCYIITFLWHFRKGKTLGMEKRWVLVRRWFDYKGAARGNLGGAMEPFVSWLW